MELATSILIRMYTRRFGAYSIATMSSFDGIVYLIGSDAPVEVVYSITTYNGTSSTGSFTTRSGPSLEFTWQRSGNSFRIGQVEANTMSMSLNQGIAAGTLELLSDKRYSIDTVSLRSGGAGTANDLAFFSGTLFEGEEIPCSIYRDVRTCSEGVWRWSGAYTKKDRVSSPSSLGVQSVLGDVPYSPLGALFTFLVSTNQSEVSLSE